MSRSGFVGIDIGGTRTKAVLTMGDDLIAEVVHDTPGNVAGAFEEHLARVLDDLGGNPAGVGVVVPGLVDDATGRAAWSANLGWRDLDLPSLAHSAAGVPAVGGHDVRAGLLAESTHGAGRGCDNVMFVPLGTGVAAALMSGGQVVSGSAWTGEIGHVRVGSSTALCGCGALGCLETVVGGRALGSRWQAATGQPAEATAVTQAVAAGDSRAADLWTEVVCTLAQALAPAIAVAGVERVIIGGGLSNAGEVLLAPLQAELAELLPGRRVEVVVAALGDNAAALGAAELARRHVEGDAP